MLDTALTRISDHWQALNTSQGFDSFSAQEAALTVLKALDTGDLRIAAPTALGWQVNEIAKQAILLYFKTSQNTLMTDPWLSYDKVPLKFAGWQAADFAKAQIRSVPGSIVRYGAYIGPNVVLMPSFVNIGAYVGPGTMIDTWATIGSCAQIGSNCHISGGAGIGGVLEPLQAAPVIIEDNCFIGARSEIVEGVRVEAGAVIGMGVFISPSTPIINRHSGEIVYGHVPSNSVILAGSLPGKPLDNGQPGPHVNCAVIIKQVDDQTRRKTSINALLRDAYSA